jgi:hypothetical protein
MKLIIPVLISAASAADTDKLVITTVGDSITEGSSIISPYINNNYPI